MTAAMAMIAASAAAAPVTDRFLITADPDAPFAVTELVQRAGGSRVTSVLLAGDTGRLDIGDGVIRGRDVYGVDIAVPVTFVEWVRVKTVSADESVSIVLRLDAVIDPQTWAPRGQMTRVVLHGGTAIEFETIEPELDLAAREFAWSGTGGCEVRVPWDRVLWVEYLRPDTYVAAAAAESAGELATVELRDGESVELLGRRGCLDIAAARIRGEGPAWDAPLADVRAVRFVATVSAPDVAVPAVILQDAEKDSLAVAAGQPVLERGTRIRVTVTDPGGGGFETTSFVGTLVDQDDASITMSRNGSGSSVVIPRETIDGLAVSGGPGNPGAGIAIGLAMGATIGGLAGYAQGDDDSGTFFRMTAGEKAAMGAVSLGLLGAIVGGLASSGERWEPVETDAIQVGVSCGARGETGFFIAGRF